MRITYLLQDAPAIYGAERATLDLLAGLAHRDDVEVDAVLIKELRRDDGRSEFSESLSGIVPCMEIPTQAACSWPLAKAVRNRLRRTGAQCLHTVGYKATLHGGAGAGFGRLAPCVTTVHGWLGRRQWKEQFYRWVDQQAMRRFQRVIVLSRFYESLLERTGVARQRLARIPSGLELQHATRPIGDNGHANGRPRERIAVGILGRLSEEKNHAMFLSAARKLLERGREIDFVIAGDGPLRQALLTGIRRLGLEGRVHWRGFQRSDEFFGGIDVLAVCSRIENLPYVILEAMTWSVPVVATRVGGIPDLVADGENGRLVESDDAEAMADALAYLGDHEAVRRRWGAAGRQKLQSEFTVERMVAAHVSLYREVVNGRH